ncbi:MAG TPA: hypothetical protein VF033_11780 [Steroidobacteraceae bacterium]
MRLKSLKVRRAEAADKALDDHLRAERGTNPPPAPSAPGPVGRVRHDERGMAVWDWAAAAGDTAALSATNVMRTLDVSGLSIEQTQRSLKAMEPTRDPAGGGDPYNQVRDQGARPAGDPFKRGSLASGDPYNKGNVSTTPRRPPPKSPAPASPPQKKPGGSVLDQLLGKKK